MPKTKRQARPDAVTRFEAPMPSAHLLTASDVAKVLAISTTKLAAMTKAGEIPCVRLGRAVRYDRADLEVLIERSKVQK